MGKKSLLASGLSLSFLTLCSRVLGLLREMTKARFLGTSAYADAFGIAFMIPNLFRRLFAENAVSVAFIPTFRGYLEGDDRAATRDFLRATLTLVSFLTAAVVAAGIAVTPLIIPFFYDGGDAATLAETALLTRIMFPYLFVISVAAFFQGVLNGVKVFAPSGFTPVLFNALVVAATYALAPRMANPARAMAVGVVAGGCVQALFQLPFVVRAGWAAGFSTLRAAFRNPGTRKVMRLILPTVVGMAAYQLNDVVSTALAGRAGEGIVSSLQYSLRLQELILGIFAVSIGTVILPDLSGLAKSARWEQFNAMLANACKIIALIAIPITFLALVCGEDIISLVYKSRSFDDGSVALTLRAFRWHIAGLFFIATNRIVSPAFYAQGNTKSPTLAGIIGFGVNIALALALVRAMSGGGIALALTAASAVNTAVLFVFLKRNPVIDVASVVRGLLRYALKLTVLSLIAAVPAHFVRQAVHPLFAAHGRLLAFGIPLAASALTYGALGVVLLAVTKDELVRAAVARVRRR